MKWFVLNDQEILGPFGKEHILESFSDDTLIWGPNLSEWSDKSVWLEASKQVTKRPPAAQSHATPSTTSSPEKIKAKTTPTEEALKKEPSPTQWFYACSKEKFGPFPEADLIQVLKMLTFSSQVYLWNKSLENWAKLEDFPEIMAQLTGDSLKNAA